MEITRFKFNECQWDISNQLLDINANYSQCFKHWDKCYCREDAIRVTCERLIKGGYGIKWEDDIVITDGEGDNFSKLESYCKETKAKRIEKKLKNKLRKIEASKPMYMF